MHSVSRLGIIKSDQTERLKEKRYSRISSVNRKSGEATCRRGPILPPLSRINLGSSEIKQQEKSFFVAGDSKMRARTETQEFADSSLLPLAALASF